MKNKIIILKNGFSYKILDKIIKNNNTVYLVLNEESNKISIVNPTDISSIKF